jgi:hypothetical protein
MLCNLNRTGSMCMVKLSADANAGAEAVLGAVEQLAQACLPPDPWWEATA